MLISGEWLLCDDGVQRPVIRGHILTHSGQWQRAEFLVDTGADRTVLAAATLSLLGLTPIASTNGVAGLGGKAPSVVVATEIRLRREEGNLVVFRGEFAGVTDIEALDMSVLGRDVTGLFAAIVDRPGNAVCLVGQRHRYRIDEGLAPYGSP
jgi:hypothetical protein